MLKYSNKRHRLLLRYDEILRKQGTELSSKDQKLDRELIEYQKFIQGFVLWNMRVQFLTLFQEFLKTWITPQDFDDRIYELQKIYIKEVESYTSSSKKLKNFQPKEKAINLNETLNWIFKIYDNLEFNWWFNDDPRKKIQDAVKLTLPEIAASVDTIINGDYLRPC